MKAPHYTFGDNERAAARLALLAQVYEPTTRALLGALQKETAPGRILDLGCGPGYTTELVHVLLGADETWGLDTSEQLIERARARLGPAISFAVHDVTTAPLPVDDVDLAYARHLLAHMADPRAVLLGCAASVRAGGRLVLEETAALESPDLIFTEYYGRVRDLQRHYGQDTFVGGRLDQIADGTPWKLEHFERTRLALDARAMATLHAMNVRTWKLDPFAASAFDGRTIKSMIEALDDVATGDRHAPPVQCTLGQAVLRR